MNDQTPTDDADITEIKGYGLSARFRGIDTKALLVAILILVSLTFVYFQWEQDRKTDAEARAQYIAQHAITHAALASLSASNAAILASLKEIRDTNKKEIEEMADGVNYVLSRTQKQREALDLQMPNSIRRKILERRERQ